MAQSDTPGARFREATRRETPLQVVGVINAYAALQARQAGFRALYLSGAGVANASHAWPDLGLTTRHDVVSDLRRICAVNDLPFLVDADTGWGDAFQIARTVRELSRAGAAAIHIEDQSQRKRCGHRPGKRLVSVADMQARLHAAVEARGEDDWVLMARTDAFAVEGLNATIDRAQRYVEAGADMIFAEALPSLEDIQAVCQALARPVLINLTEFGRTPLYALEALRQAGVGLVLYPLSAFRAMSRAAERVYREIRQTGTQRALVAEMQTRDELYAALDYHGWERRIDGLPDDSGEGS